MSFAQIAEHIVRELQKAEPEIRHLITELNWPQGPQQGYHHHTRRHGNRRRCPRQEFCPQYCCPVQKSENKDYQANLDVKNYSSDEINVKIVDNFVVVEGNQVEKEDELGTISRNFVRRYRIPEEFNLDEAVSSLSNDGILSIRVPLKASEQSKERVIPIQKTGKSHQETQEDSQPSTSKAPSAPTETNSPRDDSTDFEMVKDNLD
ncbi:Alpha crystallin/Hsp20 domain [Sergentomyia squamirostris]